MASSAKSAQQRVLQLVSQGERIRKVAAHLGIGLRGLLPQAELKAVLLLTSVECICRIEFAVSKLIEN